ncbi:hypothetical protein PHYBOEH_002922 [Phytophthora boehmeriae]|uniref:DUF5745 domain-containing protein n=1 Tax=Phytophthora boehmeriae TaxID=109152 RepID=A0A8T1WVX1_9STRA|nr:hypothetical protein PHYBOEH_002922 [Phytophthora boehmeriae]
MGFGDRAFAGVEDLVASVSSMSVALFEKLFQFRLRDVERVPRSRHDYEHNAQLVADALHGALLEQSVDGDTVDELTGERLCAGDLGSIRRLLRMLDQVYTLLFEESQEVGEKLRDTSFASLGMTDSRAGATRRVPPKLVRKLKEGRPDDVSVRERRASKETTRSTRRSTLEPRQSAKQEEIRVGRAVSGEDELRQSSVSGGSAVESLRQDNSFRRTETIAGNNKKRARRLELSFKASGNSKAEIAAKEASRKGIRQHSSRLVKPASKQEQNPTATEKELLETKRYGRFVAATGSEESNDDKLNEHGDTEDNRTATEKELLETKRYGRFVTAAGSEESDDDKLNEHGDAEEATANASRGEFFEGVSSVQHNSDESMHFIEDDGAFAQNFSSISIEGATPEVGRTRGTVKVDKKTDVTAKLFPPRKSTNQQQAEEDDDGFTTSPAKKKVARDEPHAPERAASSRVLKRDPSKSLYPLTPKAKRAAATSKAQAQYLRYKLSLKDHLQELRKREMCQRLHLERAYRSGEHMANVDKIRSRRFEQDVRLHRIAIGLEAKNEEEKQLRRAMHHLLGLEKEKLREEHRLTTSVLKEIQKEHTEREQAMENFYANQIKLVKEQTHREAKERELVEKAQRSASEQMIRELRKERESQLTALLQEKQHLAETRRFRHASEMAQLLEKTDEVSAKRTDAFYTAAMKARERHSVKKKQAQRRSTLGSYRSRGTNSPYQSTRLSASTRVR